MREEKDGAWQGEEEPWPERFEILGGTGEADVRN